jgi:hypothetical protein
MGADDTRWVMAHLGDEQQRLLQDLLDELAQLGIPAQPELIREALSDATPLNAIPEPAVAPAMRSIAALSANAAYALLHTESEEFTGRVLAMAPWAWASDFLHLLPLLKQRSIKEARASWAGDYEATGIDRPVDQALLRALAKASDALQQADSEAANLHHSGRSHQSRPLLSRLSAFARRT